MKAYTVVLSPDPDGGYSVSCPAMPGAVSQGETREETLANIAEAMGLWLEVAADDGYAPLDEHPALIAKEVEFVLGWRAEEGLDLLVETAVVEPASIAAAA